MFEEEGDDAIAFTFGVIAFCFGWGGEEDKYINYRMGCSPSLHHYLATKYFSSASHALASFSSVLQKTNRTNVLGAVLSSS